MAAAQVLCTVQLRRLLPLQAGLWESFAVGNHLPNPLQVFGGGERYLLSVVKTMQASGPARPGCCWTDYCQP